MPEFLDRNSADAFIRHYLSDLSGLGASVRQQIDSLSTYQLLKHIKRTPLGCGRYANVSLFESCNRIFSDLVILFGVQELFHQNTFPFSRYKVRLGTEQGMDIEAEENGSRLAGEAFNVASSFFKSKLRKALENLDHAHDVTYKIVLFNSDAIIGDKKFSRSARNDIRYLPIDVNQKISKYQIL